MLGWIALICLVGALIVLIALAVVDLKTKLLPNEMVLGFATLGIIFHLTTMAEYIAITDIALGGLLGFATLYVLRAVANRIYNADALGLGDVKLMGAAGLWLGPDMVMLSMSLGAMASLSHGFFYGLYLAKKHKTKPQFSTLQIPAGPGFAIGIIATGIYKFWTFSPF